jgi:predicted ferric reductase
VSWLFDDRLLWFVNRGTGLIVLSLLTASVLLGVLSTVRASSSRWPRFVTQALHRNISLLALALLAAHVGAAVIDDHVDVRWYDAFVPFGASYRPLWLTLGAVALDVIVIAAATGVARRRFSRRNWRAVHMTSYGGWVLGVVHGIGVGTDTRATWSVVVTALCVGLVAGAGALRAITAKHEQALVDE